MKAAVVCANEDVQYLDYEEPIPGPGEVKVKVRASGICGSDIPRVLHNGDRRRCHKGKSRRQSIRCTVKAVYEM